MTTERLIALHREVMELGKDCFERRDERGGQIVGLMLSYLYSQLPLEERNKLMEVYRREELDQELPHG